MKKFVTISQVAEVNPKIPNEYNKSSKDPVTFLPMAAVSEQGIITTLEEGIYCDVVKGYRYFENGDIIVAKITPCMENGKAAYVENLPHNIGFGSTEFHVIRPSNEIDGRYLFYMVWSPDFRSIAGRNMTGTAGQKRVPTDFIKRYKIPLPPIEEQKRIATIVDKADRIRRKRQEAIRLTEELGRSIFLDMFGDPVTNPKGLETRPLGDIATFLGGGTPARSKDEYFQGDICWASSKDMGNEILVDTQEHITQEAIDNSSTRLVPSGTLLVVVKSKILMRRLPVSRTAVDTCFNQDIKAIVPRDLSLTRYLQLHLKLGQETLLRQARGVNTEDLTLEHLRKYPVLMPKQESIEKITVTMQELERMLLRNRSAFQESENLFNSLLQRAFRGEL